MVKKIPDLTHPGSPGLAMTMSKEEHSFPYDAIAGTGAKKYQIMIGLIKDAHMNLFFSFCSKNYPEKWHTSF